ncbi:MAG: ribonucleoside-diphosphate reductase beta chain, partial [Enterobacterales bacterium]
MLNWDTFSDNKNLPRSATSETKPVLDSENTEVDNATEVQAVATETVEETSTKTSTKTSAATTMKQPDVLGQSLDPVRAEDKRVVNGLTDVNQLAPFKYPWAWEYFLNANKNHWTPLDVNMTQDIYDYKHKLSDNERHVYTNVLSYLTTSDIMAMRNIGLAVMEKMTAPELQIYQARQVYEEALHTWTYQHCIETLGLDQGE